MSSVMLILVYNFFTLSDPYVKVTFSAREGSRIVYLNGHRTHVVKKVSLSLSLSLSLSPSLLYLSIMIAP